MCVSLPSQPRLRLCLELLLPSWPGHCLLACVFLNLVHLWLRHHVCLVILLPSWPGQCFWPCVLPLPTWLGHGLCLARVHCLREGASFAWCAATAFMAKTAPFLAVFQALPANNRGRRLSGQGERDRPPALTVAWMPYLVAWMHFRAVCCLLFRCLSLLLG